MKDIIINLKKSDSSKIQLTIAINFISSKDNDEECIMHSKRDNTKIMINHKADEVIEKFFESPLNMYLIGLETSMRGSSFIFDCFHFLYYKCQKKNFKRGGSCVDSPNWIKTKK